MQFFYILPSNFFYFVIFQLYQLKLGQKAWEAGHRLNGKLLGFKFGAWEGGHRVPFLARWPAKIPDGEESDALISQIDLLPTFAALANANLPKDAVIDGVNQLPVLTGKSNNSQLDTDFCQSASRCVPGNNSDWPHNIVPA